MGNIGVGSTGGVVRDTTPAQEMAAFDALPADVRACFRDAKLEWPCKIALVNIQNGKPPSAIIATVENYESRLDAR